MRTLNRNVDFGARFAHKHAKSAQILKLFNAVLETICFFAVTSRVFVAELLVALHFLLKIGFFSHKQINHSKNFVE